MELVARGRIQRGLGNLAVHFVLELIQQRRGLAVDFNLKVDEQLEVFVFLFGMLLHQRAERLAFDEIGDDGPFPVRLADLVDLGNVQSRFLHARLIERFVEDVGF